MPEALGDDKVMLITGLIRWEIGEKAAASLMAVIVVTSILASSPMIAVAQEGLSLDVELPSEATVGEDVSISASITVPDLVGSYESDLTVSLYVNGQRISSKTITVSDGESTTVSFSHSFDSAGTHMIEVEAGVSLSGQTFSESVSREIDVSEVTTAIPTATPSTSLTTAKGAAFTTPASLKDDIESYRDGSPLDLGTRVFVLANRDELYLVFTDKEPKTGLVTVEGLSPNTELTIQGLTFNVLAASSVAFSTMGQTATVGDVVSNPSSFRLELIRIQATHRRVATLTDTDQGNDPTLASSSGVLVENPSSPSDTFERPGKHAHSLSVNSSTDKLGSSAGAEVDSLLNVGQPRLYTFGFRTEFWSDTEARVDGIVLTPGSKARDFVTSFDSSNIIRAGSDEPLLYVVDTGIDSKKYDSVSSLNSRASDGDIVTVEAKLFGQKISVQETLEHSTPCGADIAQIPTPSGPICVDLVQDTHIHAGAIWTSMPESKSDILLVVGLSSRELDAPNERIQGRYRLVGEVISTSRFDESLPDGRILVIYDMERLGGLDYESISEQGRSVIEEEYTRVQNGLSSQILPRDAQTVETAQSAGEEESSDGIGADGGTTGSSTDADGFEIGEPGSDGPLSDVVNFFSGIADSVSDIADGLSGIFG